MAKLTGNIEHFIFSIPGVSQELKVVGFSGCEKISAPFRYSIELACEDAELDFDSCINKPALLTLIGDHDNIERYVHGIVQHMSHVRHAQQFTIYSIELVAQLDCLTLRRNSRIYQNTTVPDIIQSVFKDAKISADQFKLSLNATYEAREYCVQYRETDLQFVARLMEEEGIYYYFEHSKEAHLLIIADNANVPKAIGDPNTVAFHTGTGTVDAEDAVRAFSYSEQVQSGMVTLRDFNFKKPALGLQSQKQASQFTNLEVYDYPGGYDVPGGGNKYAQIRLEALQAAADQGQGESNCLRLLPGFRMKLDEHPRKKMNQEYLLTEMTCRGRQPQVLQDVASGEGTSYNNNFSCIPSSVPYRVPQDAKKPRIDGVQTAIVTGPAGEEIYVDEHGRVKVQFHWDREGKNDEKSSCWIRVSQLWAGAGWGAIFIPRIAQEVVVDFIEGDPDRPIITGRVFHGTNRPPYKLPDEKTKSTIKSDSTKGGGGSNEFRFEDIKGNEEIYLHGQKDWNIRIENDTKEWIGHDRHLLVMHDQLEQVKGDKHQYVKGDHNIKIDGTLSIEVGADVQQKTAQHYAHDVGSEIHLKGGQKVVIEAGAELSLKAGGSFVKLDGSGVTVLGAQLKLNQGGSAGSGAGIALKAPVLPQGVGMNPAAPAGTRNASVVPAPISPPPSPPPVTTGLGADVDTLLQKSPSLQKDLAKLDKERWTIEYGPPGGGSTANRKDKLITIDSAEKGSPTIVTQTLAHEVGHATHPYKEDYSSKAAYLKGTLGDEGAATLNNIKVQREILTNGGPDIGIAGNSANHAAYNKAYDQFLKDGNASAAQQSIGARFGQGEITSNTGQPYADYYGGWYDKAYPPKK